MKKKLIQKQFDSVFSATTATTVVEMVRDILWPDGTWKEPASAMGPRRRVSHSVWCTSRKEARAQVVARTGDAHVTTFRHSVVMAADRRSPSLTRS